MDDSSGCNFVWLRPGGAIAVFLLIVYTLIKIWFWICCQATLDAARPAIQKKIGEVYATFSEAKARIDRHQDQLQQLDRIGRLLALVSLEASADILSLPDGHHDDLHSILIVAQELGGRVAATTDQGILDDCKKIDNAHKTVDLLRAEVEILGAQVGAFEQRLTKVSTDGVRLVRKEAIYIHSELDCFVQESRRFLEARVPVASYGAGSMGAAHGQIVASATVLAELADLLYSSESIVKKGCGQGHGALPLERAIDRLEHLDPDDHKYMKKKYIGKFRKLLPRPLIGMASVASLKGLRMREGPTTSSPVLLSLPNGTKLEVLTKSGTWWQVRTSDTRTGWVSSQYLRED